MAQTVTFFRKRDEDPGKAYDFKLQAPNKALRVLVYARRPLKGGLVQSRSAKDFEAEIDKVRVELLKGGGLVARVEDEGGASRVRIVPVPSEGYTAPCRALLVGAGSTVQRLDLQPDQPIEVPLGGHLILPAEEAAQTQLETLAQHLRWFSRDVELLVLDSIARPSLDWRVEELENHIFRNVQRAGAQAKGRNGLMGWITPASVVLAVLGLLLLLNGIWLQREVRGLRQAIAKRVPQGPQGGSGSMPPSEPAEPVEMPSISNSLQGQTRDLIEMLSQAGDQTYQAALYRGHFSKFANADPEEVFRSADWAWGLAKLALLNSGELQTVRELVDPERRSETKRLLLQRLDKMDETEVSALAYAACHAFGIPAFPRIEDDAFKDEVPLSRDCKQIEEDEVVEGFKSMRNKLRDNLTNA